MAQVYPTARSSQGKEYPWGSDEFDPKRANTKKSNLHQMTPVHMYRNDCTPDGVWNLSGNVWEWTNDVDLYAKRRQIVIGLIIPIAIYAAGIGNGWELPAFAIGYALVGSATGWFMARLMGGETPPFLRVAIGALSGSAVGSALLLIPIAWGFAGVLLPLARAIAGYYFAARD